MPVLTKKDLRAYVPQGFIHSQYRYKEAFASGEIEMVSTSGTSGDRVSVTWNQHWWDLSEREASRLHPVLNRIFNHPHREAILTTPVCAGNICHVGQTPMSERITGNLLFLNQSFDPTSWDDREIHRMVQELASFQPEVIEADPAYLAILSRACTAAGYALFQPDCIVLTYEYPAHIHYRQIAITFPEIPVISSYGSTETGNVFIQCEKGLFHQNTATCQVEVQPLRPERGNTDIGRILITTLDNPWSVLVHYDVGDLARLQSDQSCACGQSDGLILKSIEGRTEDITFNSEYRVVTVKMLDDALIAADGLINYRIEQTGPHNYLMRYVAETRAESRISRVLIEILKDLYGRDAEIELRREATLQPEQSGKYRLARLNWQVAPR